MKNRLTYLSLTILFAFLSFTACKKNDDGLLNLPLHDLRADEPGAGEAKYDLLGWGYDVTGEYANPGSAGLQVIDMSRLDTERPAAIVNESPTTSSYVEQYAESAEQYSQQKSNSLNITTGFKLFGASISSGFSQYNRNTYQYDYKYIFSSYDVIVQQKRFRFSVLTNILKNYLSQGFLEALNTATPDQIVRAYGTHVLTDVYTGGKLSIMFQSETDNSDRATAAKIGINAGVGSFFTIATNQEYHDSLVNKNFSRTLSYRTTGGDPTKALVGEINADGQASSKINISNWQSSVTPENSVLIRFGADGLLPIWELIDDPVKKAAIQTAAENYIAGRLVTNNYTPGPIYSHYNGDFHIYSTKITPPSGYWYEGVAFYAYTYPVPHLYNVHPILQFRSNITGAYIYVHPAYSLPPDYKYQKIAFYAPMNDDAPGKPLYRYVHVHSKDRYYTTNFNHLGNGNPNGYALEGVAMWVY